MKVIITTLEMLQPPSRAPRPLPAGVGLERATGITPEYARFLYGLVGGPWHWTRRLGWTREQWLTEIGDPGTEFWILSADGVPRGYAHLRPMVGDEGAAQVQIQQFGLVTQVIGRGLGGPLLEQVVDRAWSLPQRFGGVPVRRVWVRTGTLDGPAALGNYLARGFVVHHTEEEERQVAPEPLGSWVSTGGAPS